MAAGHGGDSCPADGKIAVGLAGIAPLALGIGALLVIIAFTVLRLRGRRDVVIPGALWLHIGSVLWALGEPGTRCSIRSVPFETWRSSPTALQLGAARPRCGQSSSRVKTP